jgi:superfamily II DNA or RNA helicase
LSKVRITVGPVKAVFHPSTPFEALQSAREFLTIPAPGAAHTKAYKMHRWDGRIRFIRSGSFLAGLAWKVGEHLEKNGWTVELHSMYANSTAAHPNDIRDCLKGVTLRDYQIETVQHALKAGRAAIQCPTGAGKTEIGAAIVKLINRPALWIVHRKELLHQTHERLVERLGIGFSAVTKVGAGDYCPGFVTVGMVQTLGNLEPNDAVFEHAEVLIIDEVHHLAAKSWLEAAGRCVKAPWRFGLSGTIITGHDIRDYELIGATGPLYVTAGTMELVREGYLAAPNIQMLDVGRRHYPTYERVRELVLPDWRRDPRRLAKLGGALYRMAYELGIIENSARNLATVKVAAAHAHRGEKVLVLCMRLAHGKKLLNLAMSAVDTAKLPEWISGEEEDDDIRRAVLERFRGTEGGAVLIASTIFDEGLDIPQIDVLIVAGAGESYVKAIQRVGRALRPRKDKSEVLIYDFLDGADPHHPKDYLAKHTKSRIEDYKGQGFSVVRKSV